MGGVIGYCLHVSKTCFDIIGNLACVSQKHVLIYWLEDLFSTCLENMLWYVWKPFLRVSKTCFDTLIGKRNCVSQKHVLMWLETLPACVKNVILFYGNGNLSCVSQKHVFINILVGNLACVSQKHMSQNHFWYHWNPCLRFSKNKFWYSYIDWKSCLHVCGGDAPGDGLHPGGPRDGAGLAGRPPTLPVRPRRRPDHAQLGHAREALQPSQGEDER